VYAAPAAAAAQFNLLRLGSTPAALRLYCRDAPSMSFLAPVFLLGGLAIALPVIFHLIRRSTRERTAFSSLMFLFPTPPRLTKRSRLEHLLLLALRCLVICLLAFGFARPFIKKAVSSPPPSSARRIVLLVDSSASMRRANLWSDARNKAQEILRQTTPADGVAIITFDRQVNSLVSFEAWDATPPGERIGLVTRKLGETAPGWASTRLDSALIQAAENLADARGKTAAGTGEIVVIGDFQEGSRLEQLQGYEWPRNLQVTFEPLKPKHLTNASLQLLPESDRDSPEPTGIRVRVSNTSGSKREQFKVGWTGPGARGFVGGGTDIYVPPGQSRVLTVPVPPAGTVVDRIILQGDEEDFDNSAFTLPLEKSRVEVLYCGKDAATDAKQPLYFLLRAFQETRHQAVQVRIQAPTSPPSVVDLHEAALIVIADSLSDEMANALYAQASGGKTLFCMLKTAGDAATLAKLAGMAELHAEEARPSNYAMLADIDFRDPLLLPFADPRFSDFTKIHFWNYRRLDAAAFPNAHVLAKFDTGDVALVDVTVGKGRVLVLTSGWQPEDSQLALSTKFVPLLYSILERSGAPGAPPAPYLVGDVVPLGSSFSSAGGDLRLITPGGSELSLAPGETNFSGTVTPGIYTVTSGQSSKRFAVNLDPAESRTAPLSLDVLEQLGVPVSHQPVHTALPDKAKSRLQNSELENHQKLWRWLITAGLLVLLLEIWAAGRASRRATPPLGAANLDREGIL